jgi:arginine utilization regulatory protein
MSHEILSAILNGIDEGIHAVDLNGKTIFYNKIAAQHDGVTIPEVIGKPLLEVFPSLTNQSSTLLKVIESKVPIYNQPQSYVNLHGKKIETINTTLPIWNEGKMVGAVEIAKDYSRLKILSEKLVDLQKRIHHTKKDQQTSSPLQYSFESLKTIHPELQKMKDKAEKLAKTNSPILIIGESGTGKELFVQGIHHASLRSIGPFIVQNCAAIPESLLESLLFGTSKGSFTGAVERPGLFEIADGGTLFLDEIHAMPVDLQAKLLRVLEDGDIRRLGSTKSIRVDVRVISAMNIPPLQAIEQQKLRADLFYRLNVLMFELPPLRERKMDIPYLTDYFINCFNEKLEKKVIGINNVVQNLFLEYSWPGNVRELKHTVEYMMYVCDDNILTDEDLPVILKRAEIDRKNIQVNKSNLNLRDRLTSYEKELITEALLLSEGNLQKAAKILSIPRQTLQYKLKKFNAE